MPNAISKRLKGVPWWGWLSAVACFAIPIVALGGAIPGALGCGAAGYCLEYSRREKHTARKRAIRCAVVVVVSWVVFFAFLGGVRALFNRDRVVVTTRTLDSAGNEEVTVTRRSASAKPDLSDESVRRKIYSMATRMRDALQKAEDRRAEDQRRGRGTDFADKQISHIEKMHETQLEVTMKFYKISREELNDVLTEGDRMGWMRDKTTAAGH
jgi:hypothetical protein